MQPNQIFRPHPAAIKAPTSIWQQLIYPLSSGQLRHTDNMVTLWWYLQHVHKCIASAIAAVIISLKLFSLEFWLSSLLLSMFQQAAKEKYKPTLVTKFQQYIKHNLWIQFAYTHSDSPATNDPLNQYSSNRVLSCNSPTGTCNKSTPLWFVQIQNNYSIC